MTRTPQSHTVEDYLEAIYEFDEENVSVIGARVAERLGVSRATVSEKVRTLAQRGLVEMDGREIRLSRRGFPVAEDAVRRHRTAERFLTDVLKVPWHAAHAHAVKLQAGLSDEIEHRMRDLLGGVTTCPHGNPIPGTGATIAKDLRRLNEFGAGDHVALERLTEDVELDLPAMRYFEEHGLMPGRRIDIRSVGPDGTMRLRVGARDSTLGATLADNFWVRPVNVAGKRD